MTSRERVERAIRHQEPDRVPLDLGGSVVTGMHVSSVYELRQILGLDEPGTPVKVVEPFQMLGEIETDLLDAVGADVVPLGASRNMFGFVNENWKPWTTFDGTPVLVPGAFNTQPEPNGDLLMYPQGDRSAPPSGRMPAGGWYFDAIVRQPDLQAHPPTVEDNLEEFGPLSEDDLRHFEEEADRLFTATDKAIFANFGGTSFGDIATVPGVQLKYPRGIRDIEEWYISTVSRTDHVHRIFERQCEIALQNWEQIYQRVGDKVSVVFVTGTDFGTQQGLFIAPDSYRRLFFPFHRAVNAWVHQNTPWKTFIHSCGAVFPLIEQFIEAGFDIINPVQCSAAGMDPQALKETYGSRIAFWGGGIDTQHTLPFGNPEAVAAEAKERMRVFGRGGGFVFNSVHNVQAKTPAENLRALYETVQASGLYPLD